MHSYFVLEQPAGSLLKKHHRWERFANRVVYVFWMNLSFEFVTTSVPQRNMWKLWWYSDPYLQWGPSTYVQLNISLDIPQLTTDISIAWLWGISNPILDDATWFSIEQAHGCLFKWILDSWSQRWASYKRVQRQAQETGDHPWKAELKQLSYMYASFYMTNLYRIYGISGRYVNKSGVQKFTGTSGLKLSASRP